MEEKRLTALALEAGASGAAVTPVAGISFRRDFREACAANSCGSYGACWMCPPAVGDIDEMIARAKGYQTALVFQSIGALEDSYDFEGMQAAGRAHHRLTRALAEKLRPVLPGALVLGAGACGECEVCAMPQNQPCRRPERAFPSLEAYGIAVAELAAACGMRYINGENTVTYFGAVLY